MLGLTPFLLFDGDCAEAMTFYQSCLGGELTITWLGDTPMKDESPPHLRDKVAYARLVRGALDVSATEAPDETAASGQHGRALSQRRLRRRAHGDLRPACRRRRP